MRCLWHFRLLLTLWQLPLIWGMFSKRSLPDRNDIPEGKRFRANMGDVFMSNELSADRAQSLLQDASLVGNHLQVGKLASAGRIGKFKKILLVISRETNRKTRAKNGHLCTSSRFALGTPRNKNSACRRLQ